MEHAGMVMVAKRRAACVKWQPVGQGGACACSSREVSAMLDACLCKVFVYIPIFLVLRIIQQQLLYLQQAGPQSKVKES
jgi:hypothetical protein